MADTLKDPSFRRVPASSDIRLFLTDVDNGSMYYGSDGKEFRKFNTCDGMGLMVKNISGILILGRRGSDACMRKCIDSTLAS